MIEKVFLDFLQDPNDTKNHKIYLDHLLGITKDAIMIADQGGEIFRVNDEFTRLFGIRSDDVLGKSIDDLIGSQDSSEDNISITQKLAGVSHRSWPEEKRLNLRLFIKMRMEVIFRFQPLLTPSLRTAKP
jgi:PAS domain-containing protein